jgi:hypothetical protein
MTQQLKNDVLARKPYARPQIVRVRLVAEEAVLSGCKTSDFPSDGIRAPLQCVSAQGSCIGIGS